MKLFSNYETIRNLGLLAVSVIFLNQIIISCSSYKNLTCPDLSSRQKLTTEKSHNSHFVNLKLRNKKNKSEKYFDSPLEENNEEVELIVSTENKIVLPTHKIYNKIKIEDINSEVKSITKQIKRQNNSFKNKKDTDSPPIESIEVNTNYQESKNTNALFAFFAGLLGLLTFGIFRLNLSSAKKISYWAKDNRRKAEVLILAIHTILGIGGLFTGKILYDLDIIASDITRNILLGSFLLAWILYPTKTKLFQHSYLRRKIHDLSLPLIGFLLMTNIGNQVTSDRFVSAPVSFLFEKVNYQPDAKDHNRDQITQLSPTQMSPTDTSGQGNPNHKYERGSIVLKNGKIIKDAKLLEIHPHWIIYEKEGNLHDLFIEEIAKIVTADESIIFDKNNKPVTINLRVVASQKKELSKQEVSVQQKSLSAGEGLLKFFLTILVLGLFVGLMVGVGALACALACDGLGALAAIVAIGGVGGGIALLVVALRAIWKPWGSHYGR